MRIAYWDCFSGIAGDMHLGAMVGCGLPVDDLRADLAGLALGGYRIEHRRVQRGALAADKVDVVIDEAHSHAHRGLADLRDILEKSDLPAGVAGRADAVFLALCEAEAEVHGCALDEVHLHEVGAVDAIVDIVGACCGIARLGIDEIVCSPLNVGGGTVDTAHGRLPVPAPATAHLLRGAPTYARGAEIELVTPTGAALAATLAARFGAWPPMRIEAVGYGAGDADPEGSPNVLRVAVGRSTAANTGDTAGADVRVIETNLDDTDPRLVGALLPRLLAAGALDAFATPVYMKKNRPGTQITVIAASDSVDELVDVLLRHSTTLGVRIHDVDRRELARHHVGVETPWGPVRVKVGTLDGEVVNCSPEFDDCETVAAAHDVPVKRVLQAATAAYERIAASEEKAE